MNEWLEDFQWDSDEQYKAYLAFQKWARDHGVSQEIRPIDLFLIQKDHDSYVYWRDFFGDQIKSLEQQIRLLQ